MSHVSFTTWLIHLGAFLLPILLPLEINIALFKGLVRAFIVFFFFFFIYNFCGINSPAMINNTRGPTGILKDFLLLWVFVFARLA
jgi:hypothetical protein